MTPPVTSISFTDSIGAATLTNGKPFPANRFDNWTPITRPYGDLVHRQSDMTPSSFRLGTVYGCSFELSKIPQRTTDTFRYVTIADRLIAHLLNAGSCTVNTGDSDTASYSSLYLMPGLQPSLTLVDPNQLEYTLSLALFSPAGTRLVCHYDG